MTLNGGIFYQNNIKASVLSDFGQQPVNNVQD